MPPSGISGRPCTDSTCGENRDAGLRAADRIERALGNPADQRDTIEGAADTIGVMGRTVTVLAGAAVAVQEAVRALF